MIIVFMFRTLTFLLVASLFSFICFGQTGNFRDGYIIKNNNDTLFGLIKYSGDLYNSRHCTFKPNSGDKQIKFKPNDIREFGTKNSRRFVSSAVFFDNKNDTLFLEYLIHGTVDVYYCRVSSGEHYFVKKKGDHILELNNDMEEIQIDNVNYLIRSKKYIDTLKYVFNESPEIMKEVDQIGLGTDELIKITKDYQEKVCPDEACITYKRENIKPIFKVGAVAGVGVCWLSIIDEKLPDYLYYLYGCPFNPVIYPLAGLNLSLTLPFINENLTLQYELTIDRKVFHTIATTYDISNMKYQNDITEKQVSLNNIIRFNYELTFGKIIPQFNLGFFINNHFVNDYVRILEVYYPWGELRNTSTYQDVPLFSSLEFGLTAGIGAKYRINGHRDLTLSLAYHRTMRFSTVYYFYNSNALNLSLAVQLF